MNGHETYIYTYNIYIGRERERERKIPVVAEQRICKRVANIINRRESYRERFEKPKCCSITRTYTYIHILSLKKRFRQSVHIYIYYIFRNDGKNLVASR